MSQETFQLEPQVVPVDGGEARWWFNSLAIVKATSASTGGLMSILEITEPAHAAAPLHVHHHEDEAFWILDGDIVFDVGGKSIAARAGDYVFGPRDIPHRYDVGPNGCRMLFIMTPGGFDRMVIEMSTPAANRTLPPPSNEEPDWAHIAAVAAKYGNELLG